MSFDTLERFVCNGDVEGTRLYLQEYQEKQIVWDWEPYVNLQKKNQIDAMHLVLNDPRLLFDHLFVSRMMYFSSVELQTLVGNHPRTQALEVYPRKMEEGSRQQYLHAEEFLRRVQKKEYRRVHWSRQVLDYSEEHD